MTPPDISKENQRHLLGLARGAIEACLARRPRTREEVPMELRERRGVFVTLRRRSDGELRGCVGYPEPSLPLAEAVAEAAVAAATLDGRFAPVTAQEVGSLGVEISVLGPLRLVRPEEVEVGTHGLVIRHAGSSGLLLPQVASEHGWNREVFLDRTCSKAGLPAGTWRKPGVEIRAFTATVFRED